MDIENSIIAYFVIHGISTIGAIFVFFLRIEHRLTRVETKVENFEKSFK